MKLLTSVNLMFQSLRRYWVGARNQFARIMVHNGAIEGDSIRDRRPAIAKTTPV